MVELPQRRMDLLLMSDEELATWGSVSRRMLRVCQEEHASSVEISRWTAESAAVELEQRFREIDEA